MTILKHLRRNLIAYAALFIALSGSAYAATQITSKQIAPNAIKAKQVKDNGLSGTEIKDGTLTGADIDENSLDLPKASSGSAQGTKGDTGPAGVKGETGPAGPQGPQGPQGIQGVPGTARAYGYVASGGTLDTAHSSGLTVRGTFPGVYCVTVPGVSPATRSVLVSPSAANTSAVSTPANALCNQGEFQVETSKEVIKQDGTLGSTFSSEVGFTIIVP